MLHKFDGEEFLQLTDSTMAIDLCFKRNWDDHLLKNNLVLCFTNGHRLTTRTVPFLSSTVIAPIMVKTPSSPILELIAGRNTKSIAVDADTCACGNHKGKWAGLFYAATNFPSQCLTD
mmetsp:Transcript_27823/g.51929  ORF Transcript_27823/g.51929 Transcript_27823/m.51929 type:complete len:118 (-) Transcript_27823:380-733(-)